MNALKSVSIFILYLVVIFSINSIEVVSLQCKGEKNQDVDWYYLYKLPKISYSNNPLIKKGVAYLYMDSGNYKSGWILSEKDISKNDSIPAYTLEPIYNKATAEDLLWILYNDQPPNEAHTLDNGHTKGVVVVNNKEGFWLIHSVPKFPAQSKFGEEIHTPKRNDSKNRYVPKGSYAYPSSGRFNGQSFLCISTNAVNFDNIAKQLINNEITVYQKNIPATLSKKMKFLANAADGIRYKGSVYNQVNIYSKAGRSFTSFAKNSFSKKDLYRDLVAESLDTDLYAQTWPNSATSLPSYCKERSIMNVKSIISFKDKFYYNTTYDHSKWAISVDARAGKSWICVGDINRAISQLQRGGGTVCLNLPEIWKNYKDLIDNIEYC